MLRESDFCPNRFNETFYWLIGDEDVVIVQNQFVEWLENVRKIRSTLERETMRLDASTWGAG